MNGIVTAYNPTNGRAVITLGDGRTVAFTWTQVAYADDTLRHGRGSSAVGDGRAIRIGDRVTYDRHQLQTPITVIAGA